MLCMVCVLFGVGAVGKAAARTGRDAHIPRGIGKRDNYEELRLPGSVNRAAGYVVYNADTIKGIISFNRFDVFVEQPINKEYSYYYQFNSRNLHLKAVVTYNVDNKPLFLVRVSPKDHKLFRLVHEGKLNIYDDRFAYIYNPDQIDKNLIVVAYKGRVKEFGSFFTAGTKRNLIAHVNSIYGLDLDPRSITWKQLLMTLDGLE